MRRSLVLVLDPIRDLVEYAKKAEEAGFDAVWLTDFHNRSAFVRMAATGQATKRIGIGSGIAYAFGRSPVYTASAVADIDEITNGRTILGLGTGTKRMQESWYGFKFESPAPKAMEVVRLLRELWSAPQGRPFKHKGRFFDIAIDLYLRPGLVRSDIPIYLAGVNKLMVRAAGEVADGLVGHPLYSRRYLDEVVRPAIEDGIARENRQRDSFDLAGYVITSISDDVEQAREEARRQIGFYATTRTYDAILDLHGWADEKKGIRDSFRSLDFAGMTAAVSDDMLDQIAVVGTPEDCEKQLARYDGLLDHVLLYPPSVGVSADRVKENYKLMMEVFGSSS
ncbi:MAG: LLM class flavin-dependent oxidoreductase [Chloroflexi bacterium]|nr:LLM class flavin-dependent oxidoreductase [Chloroflexota bacterium]